MNLKDRLWDVRAALATIVEGSPVGWKTETLKRVPVVNGHPRPDLRNKRQGKILRILSRESLKTNDTRIPQIEFKGLSITRRFLTR